MWGVWHVGAQADGVSFARRTHEAALESGAPWCVLRSAEAHAALPETSTARLMSPLPRSLIGDGENHGLRGSQPGIRRENAATGSAGLQAGIVRRENPGDTLPRPCP